MSRAIASARQRRAGVSSSEPPPLPPSIPQPNGLTLPQVIALIDTRLIKLEKFMKDSSESGERTVRFTQDIVSSSDTSTNMDENEVDISAILDDFNSRFMMLAEEISSLKDTLMKLQTYTMDVNKMLMDERVNVLSELGNDQSMFVMENTTLSGVEIDNLSESIETL